MLIMYHVSTCNFFDFFNYFTNKINFVTCQAHIMSHDRDSVI